MFEKCLLKMTEIGWNIWGFNKSNQLVNTVLYVSIVKVYYYYAIMDVNCNITVFKLEKL
jgi:hypothetical protein